MMALTMTLLSLCCLCPNATAIYWQQSQGHTMGRRHRHVQCDENETTLEGREVTWGRWSGRSARCETPCR